MKQFWILHVLFWASVDRVGFTTLSYDKLRDDGQVFPGHLACVVETVVEIHRGAINKCPSCCTLATRASVSQLVCPSFHLSVRLSTGLLVGLPVYFSVGVSARPSVHPAVCLHHLTIGSSVCLFVCHLNLPVYLPDYLYLCDCLAACGAVGCLSFSQSVFLTA